MSKKDKASYMCNEVSLLYPAQVVLPGAGKIHAVRVATFGAMKRGFDFVMALFLLTGLSPALLVIAVAIKIDSPGPVFFRQRRTGKNGKEFEILKFRSMVADNDIHDTSCEDRYTRLGEKLRKSSVDELPQLINVLKGEMSFIGPRPWVPEYYENMNAAERERVSVRPGITGLAAAKGRNGLSVFEKIGYDLEYVRNYSLSQDVKVVVLTVGTVLTRKGASSNKKVIHNELDALKNRSGKRVAEE